MKFEVFISLLLVAGIFSAPIILAQEPEEPIIIQPIVNIDLQGVIDAINGMNSSVGGEVNAVPNGIFGLFTGWINGSVLSLNDTLVELAEYLLTTNPNPDSLYSLWQSIVVILSSFYLLIFLFAGFMFLFSSINIEHRTKAKEWLKGAIQIIIGVNVSFYLYKLILELATAITQFLWVSGFEQFFQPSNYANLDIAFLLFYLFSISFAAITLFFRQLFLLAGTVLFPIAIFLYFLPSFKNWGKLVFNLIGIFLFMQFVDAIIFIATNQLIQEVSGQDFASIVPALAFLIVGIINVLLMLYAIFHAAFSVTQNTPTIAFATGLMAGHIGTIAQKLKGTPQAPPREGNAVV